MPLEQLTQRTAKPKAANGGLKTAENWSIEQNLRRVLGRPEDLTAYQDCIQGARSGWRDPLFVPSTDP